MARKRNAAMKKGPGRPKGSITQEPDVVTAEPSRCPKCGSTEREKYNRTREQAYAGTTPAGDRYTHIVRRWTRCTNCGQARVDRTFENRPARPAGPAQKARKN